MRSFKLRAVLPWIAPVLIAGTLFGSGYTLGTWSDQARWQRLATQTQELHQQVAQIRAEQEAWQAMKPHVVYATAGLYYHPNTKGTITMHDDGPWGAHCRQLRGQAPEVAEMPETMLRYSQSRLDTPPAYEATVGGARAVTDTAGLGPTVADARR